MPATILFGAETGNVISVQNPYDEFPDEGEYVPIEDAQSFTQTAGTAPTRTVTTFRQKRIVQGQKEPDTASFSMIYKPPVLSSKIMAKAVADNRELLWRVFLKGQQNVLAAASAAAAMGATVAKDSTDGKLGTVTLSGTGIGPVQDGFLQAVYGEGNTILLDGNTYVVNKVTGATRATLAIEVMQITSLTDNTIKDIDAVASEDTFSIHIPNLQLDFAAKIGGGLAPTLETESQLETSVDLNPTGSIPQYQIVAFA